MGPNRKNRVFVDTSAFIAFALESEPSHEIAVDFFAKLLNGGVEIVTTDYVLDELITFLRCKRKSGVEIVLEFLVSAYSSGINVFAISEELFGEALGLMMKYEDQYFSCTDCVSFAVMKEMGIKDVLTLDKHFAIAGFNNLLVQN
ncbi:type II toxin-antitoxin system VapC family toxin [Candidatus Peregrinibacteria bacterium]|nr:type II toxin-antitoxin system VapC family toxin [Candidatus Peregrinibacteria bacterium]